MFYFLRQAKQLSLAQEDGNNRAVNSGTPYETEDEVSWDMRTLPEVLAWSCFHDYLLSPAVPVTG